MLPALLTLMTTPTTGNPVFPGNYADPEIHLYQNSPSQLRINHDQNPLGAFRPIKAIGEPIMSRPAKT